MSQYAVPVFVGTHRHQYATRRKHDVDRISEIFFSPHGGLPLAQWVFNVHEPNQSFVGPRDAGAISPRLIRPISTVDAFPLLVRLTR